MQSSFTWIWNVTCTMYCVLFAGERGREKNATIWVQWHELTFVCLSVSRYIYAEKREGINLFTWKKEKASLPRIATNYIQQQGQRKKTKDVCVHVTMFIYNIRGDLVHLNLFSSASCFVCMCVCVHFDVFNRLDVLSPVFSCFCSTHSVSRKRNTPACLNFTLPLTFLLFFVFLLLLPPSIRHLNQTLTCVNDFITHCVNSDLRSHFADQFAGTLILIDKLCKRHSPFRTSEFSYYHVHTRPCNGPVTLATLVLPLPLSLSLCLSLLFIAIYSCSIWYTHWTPLSRSH